MFDQNKLKESIVCWLWPLFGAPAFASSKRTGPRKNERARPKTIMAVNILRIDPGKPGPVAASEVRSNVLVRDERADVD